MTFKHERNQLLGFGFGVHFWNYVVISWLNKKANKIQPCRYWNFAVTFLRWEFRFIYCQPLPKTGEIA